MRAEDKASKYSDFEVTELEKISQFTIPPNYYNDFNEKDKNGSGYFLNTLKSGWYYLLFTAFAMLYTTKAINEMVYIGIGITAVFCIVSFFKLRKIYKELSKGRVFPDTKIATGHITDIYDTVTKSSKGVEYMEFFAEIAFETEKKIVQSVSITNRIAKHAEIGDEVIVLNQNIYAKINGKWDK